MIDFKQGLIALENILKQKTDDVVFFEVSESVPSPFDDLIWEKNMAIPIMTGHMVDKVVNGDEADIKIASILEGMVHILGIDCNFVHRDFYLKFMRRADVNFYKRIYSDAVYLADNYKYMDALIRFRTAIIFIEEFVDADSKQYHIMEDIFYDCGRLCELIARKFSDIESNTLKQDDNKNDNSGLNKMEVFEIMSLYYFNQVLSLNENHGLAQYHMGFHYYKNRDYFMAKKMWVEALESKKLEENQKSDILKKLRIVEDEIIYEKGYKAIIEGFEDEGLEHLLPLLDEYPDWWNLYFFIGLAYRKKQMFVEATEYFKKVLTLNTGHIDSMNEIAICYMSAGDVKMAEKYLKEAIRLNPINHEIICNMGILELHKGNKAMAETHINKALEIEPNDEIAMAWKQYLSKL